ncbi:NACHT, LRR and PYD domains-containing protein 3-like [Salminus brasiliensis]|uniref:NACHT, LRR and PYD domains-containing protein 3-like n=1 Tax=Salminus brasiliensis TaxID=930266 RepID=UPI003B837602
MISHELKEIYVGSTMSKQELQIHGPVNGVNGFQINRSNSPVPSGVSLKSDKSMQMPIRFSKKPSVPEKSFQRKDSNSSISSGLSLKSEKSMQMPIQFKGRPVESGKSVLSLKSEKSMPMPIQFKGRPVESGKRLHMKRSSSPAPSGVSLKSDKSMQMPIQFEGKPVVPEKSFQLKRLNSSLPSLMSLKSDKSMQMPIQFEGKPVVPVKSFQLKRSYSCVPSVLSLKSVELLPPGERHDSDTLEFSSEKLKKLLTERCQCLFEGTAEQGNPVLLNEIFTELYITEGMNENLNVHHEVSQIEATLKMGTMDKLIKCSAIFKPLPGQDQAIKTVLTKGVAGIGKTVSVQKFILDWAEGKANQDVHFIFPLPFREINLMRDQKYSLNDLLQHFIMKGIDASSSRITNHSLVFILDGLDECRLPLDFPNNESLWDPTKETSVDILLTNLIKGNLLPSAKIWITSRPAAAGLIPSDCVDRITEVRGFDEPQKEEYFKKRISDQSLASRIITHLKSLRSLYIMCHIPVFCWIAATVLERMVEDCGWDKIPRSLTQMYTYFLITQIHTKREKYSESKVTDKEMIAKLGKLAFEQLEKGNLIFYEEDLRECGIDVREASVYSGVFTQIFREEFGLFQKKVFSFVHLSIQEHLAALYVFLSFQNCGQNVLDPQQDSGRKEPATMFSLLQTAVDKASESDSGHLDLFLRFLMGFSLESNQILIQDLLVQRQTSTMDIKEIVMYLKKTIRESFCAHTSVKFFHCLNELNDSSLVDEIQKFLRNKTRNEDDLSPELWSALVFILLTSDEKLDVFELHHYGMSDKALACLLPVLMLSRKARLNKCKITVKGCAVLAIILTMTAIEELDLSHNNVQDAGVKMLCTGIQAEILKKMKKNWSCAEERQFVTSVLCLNRSNNRDETLEWDHTLETFNYFMKIFPEKYALKEFPGLQGTKIKILRLNNSGVTSVGCGFLAVVLNSDSSNLRELELSQNSIGDSGVKVLSDALKKASCKLETLQLDDCNVTELGCAALASALQVNSAVKTVSLCNNELQDSGVKLLSAGLQNPCCNLETLRLSNCSLKFEGFASLALAMRSNPTHLRVLDLSRNRPRDLGVNLLFASLEDTHCKLETLNLQECGITKKSCSSLASALSSESLDLRELDLSANDLRNSGAKLLSVALGNQHCKLQKLVLCNCQVQEEGHAALAEALHSNPRLQKECSLIVDEPEDSRLQLLSDMG